MKHMIQTRWLIAGLLALVLFALAGLTNLGSGQTEEVKAAPPHEEQRPQVSQASGFSLRMEDPEETKEAVEEKVIDPVLETYIREHADQKYTGVKEMQLVNMLLVKQTLADRSMITKNDTLDSIMGAADNFEKVWMVLCADVAVYDLDKSSDYYVAFANTMQDDRSARAQDAVFALTDYEGNTVDHAVYDYETGLAYIPKAAYRNEKGQDVLRHIQIQLLQSVNFGKEGDVQSAVAVAIESGGEIEQDQEADPIFSFQTEVQSEPGLKASDVAVSVNGIPLPEELYEYDSVTGKVTISDSSVMANSVYVTTDKESAPGTAKTFMQKAGRAVTKVTPETMKSVGKIVWTGSTPPKRGTRFHAKLQTRYYADTNTGFDGGYSLVFEGEGGVTDQVQEKLFDIITEGDKYNFDDFDIVKDTSYNQFRIWLDESKDLPFQLVKNNYPDGILAKCAHIDDPIDEGLKNEKKQLLDGGMRILYVDEEKGFLLAGVITAEVTTQSAVTLIRLDLDFEQPGKLKLVKSSAQPEVTDGNDQYSLEGAKYGVYTKKACTDDALVKTLTTNAKGASSVVELDGGTYYVKETKAPKGYEQDTRIYKVTVPPGKMGETVKTTVCKVKDVPKTGTARLKKTSSNPSATGNNANYSLAGAEFEIYSDQACTKKAGTFTTDAAGNSNTVELPGGDYYVKETKAPKGFQINKTVEHVKVTVDKEASVSFEDVPKMGKARLKKMSGNPAITNDNNCYSLAGAEFGIYSDQACTKRVAGFTTDANGMSSEVELYAGDYYIKEEKAPKGFLLNTEIQKVTIEVDRTKPVQFTDIPGEDPLGITLVKKNVETEDGFSLGNASLSGARFTVAYYDAYYQTEAELTGKTAKRTWVFETKMNEQGEFEAKYDDEHKVAGPDIYKNNGAPTLALGTYVVWESKAPDGYLLNDNAYLMDENGTTIVTGGEKYITQVTQSGEDVKLYGGNEYSRYDRVVRGDFELTKVDEFGKRLSGVAFEIQSDSTGEKHRFTTDENGYYSSASEYTPHSQNTNKGGVDDGLWFGQYKDQKSGELLSVKVNDEWGALPYDTYTINELPGKANEGLNLLKDIKLVVRKDGFHMDMGTLVDTMIGISTTAKDRETGTQYACADSYAVTVDSMDYVGLLRGETYTQKLTIMDKEKKAPLLDKDGNEVTAVKTFKTLLANGTTTLSAGYDATGLAGKAIVVFEDLYLGTEVNEENLVASERDFDNEFQTIYFPELKTQAVDKKSQTNVVYAEKESEIEDTVSYSNMPVGEEVVLKGIQMLNKDGKPVAALDADGKEITSSVTFITEASEGTVKVPFQFDGSSLGGQYLTTFESAEIAGDPVAKHEDINSETQTVYFSDVDIEKTADKESYQVGDTIHYAILSAPKEGTVLTNAVIEDKELTKGVEIDYNTILVNGKQYPVLDKAPDKEQAGAVSVVKTKGGFKVLVKEMKTPVKVTFDAKVVDQNLEGKKVNNKASIVSDQTPEQETEVTVNVPQVKIKKTADKKVYKVGEDIHYTIKAEPVGDSVVHHAVIEDKELTKGVEINYDSIRVNNEQYPVLTEKEWEEQKAQEEQAEAEKEKEEKEEKEKAVKEEDSGEKQPAKGTDSDENSTEENRILVVKTERGFKVLMDVMKKPVKVTFDAKIKDKSFEGKKIHNTATLTSDETPEKSSTVTVEVPREPKFPWVPPVTKVQTGLKHYGGVFAAIAVLFAVGAGIYQWKKRNRLSDDGKL